jgi:8-oxo-dGTP diphosphatase
MIKLGIDVHEVADTAPHFFSELSGLLVENGHEVHILTGAEETEQLIDHVRNELKLSYTHFFSITSWHKKNGAKIIYIDGNPYMENKTWNRSKAKYCREFGIQLHIDDSDIYGKYFSTPYAKYYGNTPVLHELSKTSAGGEDLLEDLSNYDDSKYKKPSVTVDIAVCTLINDDLKLLLIKRKYPPCKDQWALPGGFLDVESGESLEETAYRELEEETGLAGIPVHQLKTYGEPDRDPRTRIITTVFYTLIPFETLSDKSIQSADDAADVKWFSLKKLANNKTPLAFDHNTIVDDLIMKLQNDIKISPLVFNLLPMGFTWERLQKIYELILHKKFDNTRFKEKINSLYYIEPMKNNDNSFFLKGEKESFF